MLLSGYWRQVTRTWIIHNSRSWLRRGQDGVDSKRKPVRKTEYNSSIFIFCVLLSAKNTSLFYRFV